MVAQLFPRMRGLICNAMGPMSARWVAFGWRGGRYVMAQGQSGTRSLMIARTDGLKQVPQALLQEVQSVASSTGARIFSKSAMHLKNSRIQNYTIKSLDTSLQNTIRHAQKGIELKAADKNILDALPY